MSKNLLDRILEWEEYREVSDFSVWEEARCHASNHNNRLDKLVKSLYSGELGTLISSADIEMFGIIVRMLEQYHRHGENDKNFMSYGRGLCDQRPR